MARPGRWLQRILRIKTAPASGKERSGGRADGCKQAGHRPGVPGSAAQSGPAVLACQDGDLDSVAAPCLGEVQRAVGCPHQLIHVDIAGPGHRGADADGQWKRALMGRGEFLRRQLGPDPLRYGGDFIGAGADHDDGEFLAPQPGHEIHCPDIEAKPLPQQFERGVAGLMAESVVDDLEAVDVDHQQGDVRHLFRRQHAFEVPHEVATIIEAGQRICQRHLEGPVERASQPVLIEFPPDLIAGPDPEFIRVERPREPVVHAQIEAAQDKVSMIWLGDQEKRYVAAGHLGAKPRGEAQGSNPSSTG